MALLGFGVGCGPAGDRSRRTDVVEQEPLVMGFNEWPPYLYPPEEGREATGVVRDVLDRCVPEAGRAIRYQRSTVPEIFASLEDGTFDLHVLSFKPERAEFLVYGEVPIFQSAYRVFIPAGSNVEVESIDDFDGLRLGHKRNMRYTDELYAYLETRRAAGDLTELDHEDDVLRALAEGEIDAAVMMLSTGLRRAALLGLSDELEVLPYDIKTADYPVAVAKTSPRLDDPAAFVARLDECIVGLQESGGLDEIFDRYADPDHENAQVENE